MRRCIAALGLPSNGHPRLKVTLSGRDQQQGHVGLYGPFERRSVGVGVRVRVRV